MRIPRTSMVVVLLVIALLVPTGILHAQDIPRELREAAVADLNTRVPGIGNPSSWAYTLSLSATNDLGCPLVGGTSLPVPVGVYVLTLNYPTNQYVYYLSGDGKIVIPCDEKLIGATAGQPSATVTPLAPGTYPPYTSTTCPANFAGYAQPRLYVGAMGRVTDGGVNNLIRQNYGRSSQPTGAEMPPGTTFPVVAGPECTGATLGEAIVWWKVTYNGVTGWTAESLNGEYFLEVYGSAPAPTSTGMALPAARQPITLANGRQVNQIGQMDSAQFPTVSTSTSDVMAVGTMGPAPTVTIYKSTLSAQLAPTITIPLQPADAYEALSPSGAIVATSDFTSSATNPLTQIVLWDTLSGQELLRLPQMETGALGGVTFRPDNNQVVVYYQNMMVNPPTATTIVLDLGTGTSTVLPITSATTAATYSPNGQFLATYSLTTDQVTLWNVAGMTMAGTLNVDVIPVTTSGANYPAALAFSPDSKLLAVGGETGQIQLWDVATQSMKMSLLVYAQGQGTILTLAFSPDGTLIASGGGIVSMSTPPGNNSIVLFDVATGTQAAVLVGHTTPVYSLGWSPDGAVIFSGGDTSVRAWAVR